MAGGRICVRGAPLALKERYGGGYSLTVTCEPAAAASADGAAALVAAVSASVPGSWLLRRAAGEVVFKLPLDATHLFPQ